MEASAAEMEKTNDFVQYFSSYESLYQQKSMLEDTVRMDAYYAAILRNKSLFEGKAVLDVGAGSGILSVWAAQAGARKVYAVEATVMALHAREMAESNNVGDIVEVLQVKMEEAELPEQVDIIISEWMGYLLIYESMLDCVLVARDRWLKPGGAVFPSHAEIRIAPVSMPNIGEEKHRQFEECRAEWHAFEERTLTRYGVTMQSLATPYLKECYKYYMQTANEWNQIHGNQLAADGVKIFEVDCNTCTLDDIKGVDSTFEIPLHFGGRLHAIVGWFEVHFRGSADMPCTEQVTLSTAPAQGYTHWGHTVMPINPGVDFFQGDELQGSIVVSRKPDAPRRLDIQLKHRICHNDRESKGGRGTGEPEEPAEYKESEYSMD